MSDESSPSRCSQNDSSSSSKDRIDQEAINIINNKISNEEFQAIIQRGDATSFIFFIKNRVGDLAQVLKVFQEHNITIIRIESRLSDRDDSAYEIFVDLKAGQTRPRRSMKDLKKQLSCVEFDPSVLLSQEENFQNEISKASASPLDTLNEETSFADHDGQAIKHKSRRHTKEKLINKRVVSAG